MQFSHFFIDRPRFAAVISAMIVIFGAISLFALPVAQYPEIAPPQVQVSANYPGANAETVAATVATPLEQEINGVENMLYMSSQSTNDGNMTISITFKPGTDLDTAQVLVQNRVAVAEARLPEEVRRRGITTIKNSPDMLMVINLYSPDNSYDQTFIGNYASLQVSDFITRLDGVSSLMVFGAADYAMRIWMDPDKIASLDLTAQDVVNAVRSENIQVSSGTLNQNPVPHQNAFELNVETQGRLVSVEEFENIIVKSEEHRIVRLKDVARVELDAESYVTRGYLGVDPSVAIPIFMRPGANALETANQVSSLMEELSQNFPPGLEYTIVYNPTEYIKASMNEVVITLLQAITLVVLVVLVFLQSWRTAIIPVIAIPISLIGTFGLMLAFGFSLNMLSLFGLVLAIGIVVDDAIVVVENVERKLREGTEIRQATKETMDEVGTALVATSLVLVAVFLPTVLMEGITGQFYKQFGVTIAAATMLSTVVSLTLSPAMAAIFMKNLNAASAEPKGLLGGAAQKFNHAMDKLSGGYGFIVSKIVRLTALAMIIYAGLIGTTLFKFSSIPTGFIPQQDQSYAIVAIQLPSGASLDRTDAVMQDIIQRILDLPDIETTVSFAGFSGATFTSSSNAGAIFAVFKPMEERREFNAVLNDIRAAISTIDEGFVVAIPPPAVSGVGNAGGFKLMVQDRAGHGLQVLEGATWGLAMAANASPEVTSAFTFFETSTPRIYLDIDRERARRLDVPLSEIFGALETYVGSAYINDFNFLGRTYRVTAQADAQYRLTPDDVTRIRVRNAHGQMVPIGSVATVNDTSGSSRVPRYNLFPAAELTGDTVPGFSSGQSIARMEQLASQMLPAGFDYEWTELAYQEKQTGNMAIYIFCLSILFVFLLLAAQYESWSLPLAIILIVPMCLLSAGLGLLITGMDNNVLTQIGLVVLVGLAAKNAILIVEFAKQNEEQNFMDRFEAAIEACKTRLRPILMTAFSFILGVMPLLVASGPGFEMRQAIGITVFSGMLGVTLFGLIFTPAFYVLCRKLSKKSYADDQSKKDNAHA